MQNENINLIKQEAWKFISEGKFDLALQRVYGQVQRPGKQAPELVGIYGCCTALVLEKHREGIGICKKAKKAAPRNPNQYFLLGLAFMSADLRSQAVETFEEGLELAPDHAMIKRAMSEMGERQNVTIPFLPRSHPINVKLGQKRHEKKIAKKGKKKKDK